MKTDLTYTAGYHYRKDHIRFDKYQQPYETFGICTVFSSGEGVVDYPPRKPEDRRTYASRNVTIWSPLDSDQAKLTLPDGTPVAKTWMKSGGSTASYSSTASYLLDWDHGVAVELYRGSPLSHTHPGVPERFHACAAYIPGPKSVPLGRPCRLTRPYKPTPEERAELKAVIAKVTAYVALHNVRLPQNPYYGPVNIAQAKIRMGSKPLTTIPPEDMAKIVYLGNTWGTYVDEYPHLRLARKGQPERLVPEEKRFNYC